MSDEFFDGLVLGRSNAFKRKNQEEIELREQHQQLVAEYKSLEEQNRELRAMIKGDGAVMKKLKNALQMVDPKNLNPRFFISLLMASDSGDDTGISLKD